MRQSTRDLGNAAVELVVLTPVLCLCALFVFWCGRLGQARSQVELAASAAARAASMVSRERMQGVARSTALSLLQRNGLVCAATAAAVVVGDDRVSVSVTCRSDVNGLDPFTDRVVQATAVAPIDHYRVD